MSGRHQSSSSSSKQHQHRCSHEQQHAHQYDEPAPDAGLAKSAAGQSTAAGTIPGWLRDGDLVLLKASRGIHLETVAQAIIESREQLHRERLEQAEKRERASRPRRKAAG